MAFPRLFLLLCLVVAFLGLASVIRCKNEIENRRYGGQRERESRNKYIYKRDEQEIRVASERGEIRAVPIFRDSSELVSDLKNYELNCIRIRPNSFMLPHYITASRLLFVQQGKANVGWVHTGNFLEVELERGSVYFIPQGSIFYAINNDQSKTLVIVNLLRNPDPYTQRHHDSFYVAGGRNAPSVLSAFRIETLEAAFNTGRERIKRLLSNQNEGVFASLQQGKMSILNADHELHNIPSSKRKSKSEEEDYKPFNLLKNKPTFENANGQIISADGYDWAPLKWEDIGVAYTRIEPRAVTVPHWRTRSTRICVVVGGLGRVEIVSPEDEGQSGRERERERKRGREERGAEKYRISYKRIEDNLHEWDVFVIPAGHPSSQIAFSNQSLEFLAFEINNDVPNEINFLAGKNSVVSELRNDILAASFNETEEVVKRVFESQREEKFVKGRQFEGYSRATA